MKKAAGAVLVCFVLQLFTCMAVFAEGGVTRLEAAVRIAEFCGVNAKIYSGRFSDLDKTNVYSDIVEGEYVAGILTDDMFEDGKLEPDSEADGAFAEAVLINALKYMKSELPKGFRLLSDEERGESLSEEKLEALIESASEAYEEYPLNYGEEYDELINSVRSGIKECENVTAAEKAKSYFESALTHLSFDANESENERAKDELEMAYGALNYNRSSFLTSSYWFDDTSNLIQAHGGGVMYDPVSEKYYWYGEARDGVNLPEHLQKYADWTWRIGMGCYSSTDLYNWTYESIAFEMIIDPEEGDEQDVEMGRVFERPHVIYNEKTGKYVMWAHVDNGWYGDSKAGVAVSDSPTGPFKYVASYQPNGKMARDMNTFVDDDGTAYLYSTTDNNGTICCSQLTDDYLGFTGEYSMILEWWYREAPAVFKHDNKYYLITSGCTGWSPNEAKYAVADNPFGPFEDKGNPCSGENANKTFGGQSSCVLKLKGSDDKFIFIADIWRPSYHKESGYIWLPIMFAENGEIAINYTDEWTLDDFDTSVEKVPDIYAVYPNGYELPKTVMVKVGEREEKAAVTWNDASFDESTIGHMSAGGSVEGYAGLTAKVEVYNFPSDMIYFVNCGDEGEADDGLYNSKSDQSYGVDESTWKSWGYTADNEAGRNGNDNMYYSVRYDYSQGGEENVGKGLEYKFELEKGKTYDVYIGICDPWNESGRYEDIYVNGECVYEGFETDNTFRRVEKLKVSDVDGFITVKAARNQKSTYASLDPLVSWIIICESAGDKGQYYTITSADGKGKIQYDEGLALTENSDALWSFVPASDGSFVITDKNGEVSLDVSNGSTTAGTDVIAYATSAASNQRWFLEKTEDGSYYIKSVSSGFYLSYRDGKFTHLEKDEADRWFIEHN
ncbi:MAG: family 43 glycosylhydrolase [Clostridia bacterium]|nr:family 43 glycosylhydrolase [Clostridia bacterium]